MNLLKPNEQIEYYHIRKPNNENFLFENGDKIFFYAGGKVFSFETNDIIVNYSLDFGFNVIKFPYAYAEENIYFMFHQKYIPVQEYRTSTEKKTIMNICIKKDVDLKGDNSTDEKEVIIEYGNEFVNCIFVHDREPT